MNIDIDMFCTNVRDYIEFKCKFEYEMFYKIENNIISIYDINNYDF